MHQMVHACRTAKEQLLGDPILQKATLTIPGRGSRLIGGALTTELKRQEMETLILEGFFPLLPQTEVAAENDRSGMRQIGLPYAKDPRITAQLARFLTLPEGFTVPRWVLFNGGTLKSPRLRQRLLEQLGSWSAQGGLPPVQELPDPDYDLAVSRGAAYYGLVREGQGVRIRGGTSRSYFLGVESSQPAIPGLPPPFEAVCVAPFGMEEGSEETLEGREFALLLGEQALFRFFSRSSPTLPDGSKAKMGSSLRLVDSELKELHPLEAFMKKEDLDSRTVRVQIKSRVTELGMLEIYCVAADGRQWQLEFDIRSAAEAELTSV
jgi:hypothetical protein